MTWVVIISVLIWIVHFVLIMNTSIKKVRLAAKESTKDDLPFRDSINQRDSGLFNSSLIHLIHFTGVWLNRKREPTIFSFYDNKYSLIVHTIEISKDFKGKLFQEEEESLSLTNFTGYRVANYENFDFNWARLKLDTIFPIRITYSGGSVRKNASDSIFRMFLLCNNLSVRLGSNTTVDIFLQGNLGNGKSIEKFPLDLLFIRKLNLMYLYFLIPRTKDVPIRSGLIDSIAMNVNYSSR